MFYKNLNITLDKDNPYASIYWNAMPKGGQMKIDNVRTWP